MLAFQSKDELSAKLSTIIELISSIINSNCSKQNNLQTILDDLNIFLNNMNLVDKIVEEDEIVEEEVVDNALTGQMDRRQLKQVRFFHEIHTIFLVNISEIDGNVETRKTFESIRETTR